MQSIFVNVMCLVIENENYAQNTQIFFYKNFLFILQNFDFDQFSL